MSLQQQPPNSGAWVWGVESQRKRTGSRIPETLYKKEKREERERKKEGGERESKRETETQREREEGRERE